MAERRGARRLTRLSTALAVALAAACTGSEPNLPDLPLISPGSETPAAEGSTVDLPDAPGRLLVIDASGDLVTMKPDGTDVMALTEGAGEGLGFIQPTWSPDGDRIAWTQIDGRDGSPSGSLVTSRVDGSERTETPTGVIGFYLAWDPTSSRVAFLGAEEQEIELGIVDVAGGASEATPLGQGQPFYFSWAPEGERMLTHVAGERIEKLGIDLSVTEIAARPASFQAPIWSHDGARLVFAEREGSRQRIVMTDQYGRRLEGLVEFAGDALFVLSPDSSRLAYRAVGALETNEPQDRFAAVRAQPEALSVLDLERKSAELVSKEGALAFFWGPDERLLFLSVEVDEGVWLRWNVWDGDEIMTFGRFRPSETLARDYLPFFDQYAQSLSLWAPDGSAFAYPGTNESGQSGIWIQEVARDAKPAIVSEGSFAAWSPK